MSVKVIPNSDAFREGWDRIWGDDHILGVTKMVVDDHIVDADKMVVKNTADVVENTPDASGVNRDAGGSRADVTGSSAISGVFANYGGKRMPFSYQAFLVVDGEVHW
jgi:hypothetical protein